MPSPSKTVLLLVALAPILMSSECGLPNYGTARNGNQTIYLVKPAYVDTIANAIYISGRFSHTYSSFYGNEKTYFGELSLHRSHTWKYFNLSYGVLGYGGAHKVYYVDEYRGYKYLAGAALTGELNFNIQFKRVDWRIIGIRTTALYENGNYASFRKNAENDSLIINNNPNNSPFNISVCFEVLIKLKKLQFGYYGAIGPTLGKRENAMSTTSCLYFNHKQMTYFVQHSYGDWAGFSFSGGLTYRLNKNTAAKRGKKIVRH